MTQRLFSVETVESETKLTTTPTSTLGNTGLLVFLIIVLYFVATNDIANKYAVDVVQ